MTFVTHLRRITSWLVSAVTSKYEKGQQEHGGSLWTKAGMLAHAESEALDLVVYLPTLRDQLTDALHELEAGNLTAGRAALARILGQAEE